MKDDPFHGLTASLEKTKSWAYEVMAELGRPDPNEGYHVLRAALHVLRDHLPLPEVAHLAAQLPLVARGLLYEGWRPGAPPPERALDAALDQVRQELGPRSDLAPEAALRAAFAVLSRRISAGELADVTGALPHGLRALFPVPARG